MADAIEDDVLDDDIPTGEAETQDEHQTQLETPQEGEDGEDEVLISFDGEEGAPPSGEEKDTGLVRHLREQLREEQRRRKELERQHQAQPQQIEVGEKPTLAGCEYDEERFEQELVEWKERSAKAEAQAEEHRKAEAARQEAWEKKVAEVEAQKAKLGVKDYDQARDEVLSTFNERQQVLVMHCDEPAKMIYALGKSPAKAADLAKIEDPLAFFKALVKLEAKLTVTTQRKAPDPERLVRGSGSLAASTDKTRERLEKEAERTGDRTKVIAYNRQLKAQGRS